MRIPGKKNLTRYFDIKIKTDISIDIPVPIGWASGIRTCGMTESKSVALPLGDSPL